jgi:hypothetical protein
MKNIFYIYLHRRGDNNEIFYVGKGKNNRAWVKQHRSNYWNRIVEKYGLIVEIYKNNLFEEDAFIIEKNLIKTIGKDKLCNLTDGGEGLSGMKRTFSEEHKKNISLGLKGRLPWNKGKNGVQKNCKGPSKLILDTETGIFYESITEASFSYLYQRGHLNRMVNGTRKNKTNLQYV